MKVFMPAKWGSSPLLKVGMVLSTIEDAPGSPCSSPCATCELIIVTIIMVVIISTRAEVEKSSLRSENMTITSRSRQFHSHRC